MSDTSNILRPEQIRTASLYPKATLAERGYGTLRLVITRYWPRGIRKEGMAWAHELAPSVTTLHAYKSGEMGWESFEAAYRAEMEPILDHWREWFAQLPFPVTLLCHEHDAPEDTVRCHRRLLRNMLLETDGDA